jgi:uncharacterized protein YpbB
MVPGLLLPIAHDYWIAKRCNDHATRALLLSVQSRISLRSRASVASYSPIAKEKKVSRWMQRLMQKIDAYHARRTKYCKTIHKS